MSDYALLQLHVCRQNVNFSFLIEVLRLYDTCNCMVIDPGCKQVLGILRSM
jgi:hypothetical protein